MKTLTEIRRTFLAYFQKQGHHLVSSSPLVPQSDPTLLFTNAGMVPFKNVFTGAEHLDYKRAASAQKCIRAGGKHNDLENVGHTARHHTFFEMLGNFSFGDYFKETAIELAWTLVTREFGISPSRLLVTVFAEDEEAAVLWKKIASLPDDKIIRIPTVDNFWSMGPTGPCGPCSEIFYDHGESIWGGVPGSPDQDGDRFIEIWNLVFMQYEQVDEKTRRALPSPSIDTGMGLERVAAVLQGQHDNYDTDLFRALIEASQEISQTAASVSHRVMADHLRSTSFLIADGVLPSNEGRGYVLRRIMRRAMRHAHALGCQDPLLYRLVPTLIQEMGEAYPELERAKSLITETLRLEEERFKKTLDKGLKLLEEETQLLSAHQELPGEVAFKLYDTYGFPLDLTQDILKTQGRGVDTEGFTQAMDHQKALARASWIGSGEKSQDQIWFDLYQRFGRTEFLGYETEVAQGAVLALLRDGVSVDRVVQGEKVSFLTNQTPFYAESGGQMGDCGEAHTLKGTRLSIQATSKKVGMVHVHEAEILEGTLEVGDVLMLQVEGERRSQLRCHHSATHLLHKALRKLLGDQVVQKGSLVAPDRLRFDFSFGKGLTGEHLRALEDDINAMIRKNTKTSTRLMKPEEALQEGALALFGEKYGQEVRVVSLGQDAEGCPYSTELCGGTHVSRTGDIGFFKILSETGIAAGIRRIEAVAGKSAENAVRRWETQLEEAAGLLKGRPCEVATRVTSLLAEKKKLEKDLEKALLTPTFGETKILSINGVNFIGVTESMEPRKLKAYADQLKQKVRTGVVAIASCYEGKISLIVGVTEDLKHRLSAVDLVTAGAQTLGGKGGGGRPDMAQAGAPEGIDPLLALEKIKSCL